jgi:hypothetical protein
MQVIQPRFVEEGVWLRPFGRLIYTMPPYIIEPAELQMITSAIYRVVVRAALPQANRAILKTPIAIAETDIEFDNKRDS